MKFTIEEKIQLVKWYFSGYSLKTIISFFTVKYGNERGIPSTSGVRYSGEIFAKNGCFQNFCKKCAGYIYNPIKTDEDELNEIMVCAAAELELSIRDIALELELPKSAVSRILKRNGYSIIIEDVPQNKNTGLEKLSLERIQIVKWYCQKITLPKMIELVADNYNYNNGIKEEILNTIRLFEMYGCMRNCKRCMETTNKTKRNLKLPDVEELISKRSTEVEINLDNRKRIVCDGYKVNSSEELPTESNGKRIKLDCCVESTSLLLPSKLDVTGIESKNSFSAGENIKETGKDNFY